MQHMTSDTLFLQILWKYNLEVLYHTLHIQQTY